MPKPTSLTIARLRASWGLRPRIRAARAAWAARTALAPRVALAMGILCLSSAQLARSFTPEVNFQLQCMGCHRRDGSGQPGRVPSVRRTLVPLSYLAQGREFLIRVPGVAQAPLSDDDLAALLNWMVHDMSDVSIRPGFKEYSADEIHRQRARPLADVRAARREVMRLIDIVQTQQRVRR